MVRFVLPLIAACVLPGCVTDEPAVHQATPIPEYNPGNHSQWCAAVGQLLGDPWLSDWQKMATYEMLSNRGCLR